jgi:trk system potassium uptake protein TrkA
MKIIVCGGNKEADFVIREFKKGGHRIAVINGNEIIAKQLSENNGLDVILSDPTKIYSYTDSNVYNYDLIVSLLENDEDNFVVCKIAKQLFNVKKAICTVQNPDNVAIFKALGVDSPISASYLLTEKIKGESDVESLIKTLSMENEKIMITEIKIKNTFAIVGKTLKEVTFPHECNVCYIYRDSTMIIPRGDTKIEGEDTVVIASTPNDQEDIVSYLKRED